MAASVAEILAAIGVMLSIFYLAVQVRKAQAVAESDAFMAAENAASNWRSGLARDPQVAALYRRATEDFESLTPDEQMQANWLFSDLFWVWQGMKVRANQGVLDQKSWAMVEQNIRIFAQMKGVQQWWPTHKSHFSPDFAETVDECIAAIRYVEKL